MNIIMLHKVQKISETTKYFRNFFQFFLPLHTLPVPL